MDHSLALLAAFLAFGLSVYASPRDEKLHTLDGLCSHLMSSIDDGNFSARKKILDDCTNKVFSAEHIESMKKCRAILPMETPEDVKSVCGDIEKNEPVFGKVRQCFKSHHPDKSLKKTFKDCLADAFAKL